MKLLAVGTVFDGRYVIDSYVGVGGQAHVYKACDQRLQRVVALKLLRPDITLKTEDLGRFYREAKVICQLDHPSILRCYHMGVARKQIYICLEYLEAPDLARALISEKLPWRRALEVCGQICEGMAFAHGKGVLHRDLTPRNILLFEDRVKIIDFGLAAVSAMADQKLTPTGNAVGTPHYISPEVWRGKPADARSEVYAVGCVLYQCLTGEVPFSGSTDLAIGYEHDNRSIPTVELEGVAPESVRGLNAVLRKALAKDPRNRYQSMQELRDDIYELQNDRAPHAVAPARSRAVSWLTAIVASAMLFAAIVILNDDGKFRQVNHYSKDGASTKLRTGNELERDEVVQLRLAEAYALQRRLTESNAVLSRLLSGSTMTVPERRTAAISAAGNDPRGWKARVSKEFPGSKDELFVALHDAISKEFLAKRYVRAVDFATVLSQLPADTQNTQQLQIHGRIYMGQSLMEMKNIDAGTSVARSLIDALDHDYKLIPEEFRKERLHMTWGLIGGYPAAKTD